MGMLDWSDDYSVGIDSIDSQHKKIIGMINELDDGLRVNKGQETTIEVLDKLFAYAREHLEYEEALFKKTNYPEKEEHEKEHSLFRQRASILQKQFEETQSESTSHEMIVFLCNWLLHHIQEVDMKYKDHFIKNGIT